MGSLSHPARHTSTPNREGSTGEIIWLTLAVVILLVNLGLALADVSGELSGSVALGYITGRVLVAPMIIVALFTLAKRFRTARNMAIVFSFVSVLLFFSLVGSAFERISNEAKTVELPVAVREANKSLPRMLNSDTELTSVEAGDGLLIYNHKLVAYRIEDLDVEFFSEAVREDAVEHACSSSTLRSTFLDKGVGLQYRYFDINDILITQLNVRISNCSQ